MEAHYYHSDERETRTQIRKTENHIRCQIHKSIVILDENEEKNKTYAKQQKIQKPQQNR